MRGTWFLYLWILAILLGGTVAVHTQAPLSALRCSTHEEQISDRTRQDQCASFEILALRTWNDLSEEASGFVHRILDFITALSTLAIAYFTYTLWRANQDMVRVANMQRTDTIRAIEASEAAARAAERSAEASVGVEIPRLAVESIEFINFGAANLPAKLQFPQVAVTIRNYGRTPAFLQRESVCFEIGMTMPSKIEYDYAIDLPAGRAMNKDECYRLTRTGQRPSLTEESVAGIMEGASALWVYGYIAYRDFLNEPRWFNFRASFQVPPVINGMRRDSFWISAAPTRRDDRGPDFGSPE